MGVGLKKKGLVEAVRCTTLGNFMRKGGMGDTRAALFQLSLLGDYGYEICLLIRVHALNVSQMPRGDVCEGISRIHGASSSQATCQ